MLELNEIVIKACAREVNLRYGDASQLRADLELLRDGKSVQRARRLATWRRRAVMAAVAFAVLAVGAAILGNRWRQEDSLKWPDGPPSTNELANALRPVVLPGEVMEVRISKEGKEHNQGIAYLDDGTMIVIDNSRHLISQSVSVVVTSVLQTSAGRMIFAKLEDSGGHGGGKQR